MIEKKIDIWSTLYVFVESAYNIIDIKNNVISQIVDDIKKLEK